MSESRRHFMLVRSGRHLNALTMYPADVDLRDIAWALGHLCRFTGHAPGFYSVAEHSVLCARLARAGGANPRQVLATLLHDAAEAYLGDVARPVKEQLGPWYAEAEDRVMQVVARRFGLIDPAPAEASVGAADWAAWKFCDDGMLARELREFWPSHPVLKDVVIPPGVLAVDVRIRYLAPKEAAKAWLKVFRELALTTEDMQAATAAMVGLGG